MHRSHSRSPLTRSVFYSRDGCMRPLEQRRRARTNLCKVIHSISSLTAEGNYAVTLFFLFFFCDTHGNPVKDPPRVPGPRFGNRSSNDQLIHSLVFRLVRCNCSLSRPSVGEQVVGCVSLLYFAPPTSSPSPPV